jgi:membrane-associated protein
MLFGLELNEVIGTIGVLGVAAIIFAESGLLVGFFFPGDTLLFAAGILAQQGVLQINIHLLVFILFVAAVAGVLVGYEFGRRFGRRLFSKPDSVLFHQSNLARAEKFYEKYGPITIILARFIPVIRTFAPIVAGIGNMNYNRFLLYNLAGGLMWVALVTYMGYYGGQWLKQHGLNVETIVMPVILAVVALSLASPAYHILSNQKSRRKILQKLGLKRPKAD